MFVIQQLASFAPEWVAWFSRDYSDDPTGEAERILPEGLEYFGRSIGGNLMKSFDLLSIGIRPSLNLV